MAGRRYSLRRAGVWDAPNTYHHIQHFGYEEFNKDMFIIIKNDSRTRGHSLALVNANPDET